MSKYADMRSQMWDKHEVMLAGEETRTAYGVTYGPPTPVMASVNATQRTVINGNGEDVTVSATIKWHVDGPLPELGSKLTLPPDFGMKPDRQVVTARRVISGTGMTPDHVEVTIK